MAARTLHTFATFRTEGGLLPAKFLQRLRAEDRALPGLRPEDYHLFPGEKLSEAASRSWARLLGAWRVFQEQINKASDSDPTTNLTRERWLLPLFQELGYGRLPKESAFELDGKIYAISHAYDHVPIHLIGWNIELDRRGSGVSGVPRTSPHSLLQEFLNRSDQHLWGLLSNGRSLRILRDNVSLTRQAFVEFDLATMFDGESYRDFYLLWLLVHQSRVEGEKPETCWLEQWSKLAQAEGTRALDQLRNGVEQAISALGEGFLSHQANNELRTSLREGTLGTQDYYRQLLRMVYRLLFLFVAEDRQLLLTPEASPDATDRYLQYYSTRRLRLLADQTRGTAHPDLYEGLKVVMRHLGDTGCELLGLPALGSFLWSDAAIGPLAQCMLSNQHVLRAIRELAWTVDGKVRMPVDYFNLDSEELGSIYESLLELHPEINAKAATFTLKIAAGHERKTTGSYYTPTSLITSLLETALDPVIEQTIQGKSQAEAEAALLNLKICDPACGSGHFLIAAAHRMAKHLAVVRTGDFEPAPEPVRTAIRDIIGRCIYGVDINPMSVELCKVSLWMEALEPGKPLSFLDHHIQCGNALIGATPELIVGGIPDAAFTAIEGDDKKVVSDLKKRNKAESKGQLSLFGTQLSAADLVPKAPDLDAVSDSTVKGVQAKEQLFSLFRDSSEYLGKKRVADAWCAAFMAIKDGQHEVLTQGVLENLLAAQDRSSAIDQALEAEIVAQADQYQFFHWHLAFPEVFGGLNRHGIEVSKGFDVILGNPPWERVKLQEIEFFGSRSQEIAQAANSAARKKLISALPQENPTLYADFLAARRQAEGESHFIRSSARYPLCGRGDVNTYTIFTELNRNLINAKGRVGCIVPSGIATDDTTKFFFQDLMERDSLVSFFDFQSGPGLFGEIGHARFKFALITLGGSESKFTAETQFAFFLRDVNLLKDPSSVFELSKDDIALINPNTKTCPVFRSKRDAEITKAIYQNVPVLVQEASGYNPWGIRFMAMLHMANDSGLFQTQEALQHLILKGNWWYQSGQELPTYLPLYEAKMVHHYTHRFGDYAYKPEASQSTALPDVPLERLQDPTYMIQPRYWVEGTEVDQRLKDRWSHKWLLGWRDISRSTDERTMVVGMVPRVGVGHKFLLMMSNIEDIKVQAGLYANLSSFALDYVARQKMGGTSMSYFVVRQLPILSPDIYSQPCTWSDADLASWLLPRVLELTYTAWDLQPFAQDCGYEGPPYRWEEDRRFLLRCELDAAFFHIYDIRRDDVDYIMDSFHIVKKKDEKQYGDYRTKLMILHIYDLMQTAIESQAPYQTLLSPPPSDSRLAHPNHEEFPLMPTPEPSEATQ